MCKELIVMDIINILREEAAKKDPFIKVDIVKPPTYVEMFYGLDEKPSEIILIYKEVVVDCGDDGKSSVGSKTPGSDQYDFDLTGNPLEAPFENLDCDISIPAEKQYGHMWQKSEENHLPLPLEHARSIINSLSLQQSGKQNVQQALDVWAITKPNPSKDGKKKRHDVLLGLQISKAVKNGIPSGFARSVVTLNSPCSIESPGMKTSSMMKEHLDLCESNLNVKSKVRCVYNVCGDLFSEEERSAGGAPPAPTPGSYLDVQWKQPKMDPPLHEAVAEMVMEVEHLDFNLCMPCWAPRSINPSWGNCRNCEVINVVLGQKKSDVHSLWKQLWTLGKLFEILEGPRNKLKTVEMLPRYPSSIALDESFTESSKASVAEQLKKLFCGEVASQIDGPNNAGFARSARAYGVPDLTTTLRPVDHSKESKFQRNIEQVLSNKRINADATDDLWNILSGCDTFNDLSNSFDTVYREVKQGHWKPYIRHKNQSHTSALLRALSSDTNLTDIISFDSTGIHVALESLFELGLEKLANDYCYLFLESDLASWDDLRPPSFPRKGFGISRESWLEKCNEYLSWLTQVHATLEAILLAGLSGIEEAFSSVSSQLLSYFQGPKSLIQSANFLISPNPSLTLKTQVEAHQISTLLSRPFDMWQLELTSESPRQLVESVFHRSMLEIFPPRILSGGSEDCVQVNAKSTYCNCKLVTLMNLR